MDIKIFHIGVLQKVDGGRSVISKKEKDLGIKIY